MQSYPYELINGYPIMNVDGLRVFLHTGSAESIGDSGKITLDGRAFEINKTTLRMSPDQLSLKLGTIVDGMLGADILTRFDYKLLPEKKQIVLTQGEFHPYGYANHFELYNGVPITPVSILNCDIRLFFATGSRRTYLDREWLGGAKPVGIATDYYPGLGVFETNIFMTKIWVAGFDVELEAGLPPAPLQSMLKQTRSAGILGVDVLQGFEVCLAPRRRESVWWKRGSGGGEELEGARRDPNDVKGYYY